MTMLSGEITNRTGCARTWTGGVWAATRAGRADSAVELAQKIVIAASKFAYRCFIIPDFPPQGGADGVALRDPPIAHGYGVLPGNNNGIMLGRECDQAVAFRAQAYDE